VSVDRRLQSSARAAGRDFIAAVTDDATADFPGSKFLDAHRNPDLRVLERGGTSIGRLDAAESRRRDADDRERPAADDGPAGAP
jgi:hypothetical protein